MKGEKENMSQETFLRQALDRCMAREQVSSLSVVLRVIRTGRGVHCGDISTAVEAQTGDPKTNREQVFVFSPDVVFWNAQSSFITLSPPMISIRVRVYVYPCAHGSGG